MKLFSNFAGSSVLILFYVGSIEIEIFTFKKDRSNQRYTFYSFFKTKLNFLDHFQDCVYVHAVAF